MSEQVLSLQTCFYLPTSTLQLRTQCNDNFSVLLMDRKVSMILRMISRIGTLTSKRTYPSVEIPLEDDNGILTGKNEEHTSKLVFTSLSLHETISFNLLS